jgi:hypothetical protein
MMAIVRDALGKRVMAGGVLNVKRSGPATSLRVESLEVFPDEYDLPSVDEVLGILKLG